MSGFSEKNVSKIVEAISPIITREVSNGNVSAIEAMSALAYVCFVHKKFHCDINKDDFKDDDLSSIFRDIANMLEESSEKS